MIGSAAKLLPALVLVAALAARPAAVAGTITGKVRAEGKAGLPQDAAGGKYDSRAFKFVEKVDYSEMTDFVVYIEGRMASLPPQPVNAVQEVITKKEVQQKKAVFTPHVLPLVVNTTVNWPNNDDIFHNVFSFSDPKQFDLGLYKHPEVKSVKFDQPGQVDVFCSIHANMSCVVLVLENPCFAVSEKGVYSITNVPAGKYLLKAWHERMPSQRKEVVVPETGEVRVDFVLGINNLPRY